MTGCHTHALDTLYTLARWLLERERVDDARHVFRALLIGAPDDERGWLGLGLCHERRGDLAVAIELYQGGAVAAGSVRCHLAAARALRVTGSAAEAARALDAAEHAAEAIDDDELRRLVAEERSAA